MKELHDALLDAFDAHEFEKLLRFHFDENLDTIVSQGPFDTVVFQLIQLARRQGWLGELVLAACEERPHKPVLQSFRSDPGVLEEKLERVEGKLDQLKKLQMEMAFQLSRDLLGMRYKAYGRLWSRTKATMIYTADAFDPKTLLQLKESLSDWYFSEAGGIFLTDNSRDFYFALQDLVQAVCGFGNWTCDPRPSRPKELFFQLFDGLELASALKDRLKDRLKDPASAKKEGHASIDSADWSKCCEKIPVRLKSLVDGKDPRAGAMVFAAVQQVASVLRSILVRELGSRRNVEGLPAR